MVYHTTLYIPFPTGLPNHTSAHSQTNRINHGTFQAHSVGNNSSQCSLAGVYTPHLTTTCPSSASTSRVHVHLNITLHTTRTKPPHRRPPTPRITLSLELSRLPLAPCPATSGPRLLHLQCPALEPPVPGTQTRDSQTSSDPGTHRCLGSMHAAA